MSTAVGERLSGFPRERLAYQLRGAYEYGATIAELAQRHGRTRGLVRKLLVEAETALHPRGRRTRPAAETGEHQPPACPANR
jgi:transposase-like protein